MFTFEDGGRKLEYLDKPTQLLGEHANQTEKTQLKSKVRLVIIHHNSIQDVSELYGAQQYN